MSATENTRFTWLLPSTLSGKKRIFFLTTKFLSNLPLQKKHRLNGVVEISDEQELLLSSENVELRQQVKQVLECFREELDDHRLAINENTTEIISTNDFLNELNCKLDKLSERLDELTLLLKGQKQEENFELRPLSGREKDVFQVLYLLTESQPYASYEQIAKKSCMTKELVMGYVTSIIQKGVPVLKKYDGSVVFLRLEPAFRQKQSKENIVGINSLLTDWLPRR